MNIIKQLLGALIVALISCNDPNQPPLPVPRAADIIELTDVKGFEDCLYTDIIIKHYPSHLYAIRCPGSTVSVRYNCGKNCDHTVTVSDTTSESSINRVPECENAKIRGDEMIKRIEADNKKPALPCKDREDLLDKAKSLDDFTHTPKCSYVHSADWKPEHK